MFGFRGKGKSGGRPARTDQPAARPSGDANRLREVLGQRLRRTGAALAAGQARLEALEGELARITAECARQTDETAAVARLAEAAFTRFAARLRADLDGVRAGLSEPVRKDLARLAEVDRDGLSLEAQAVLLEQTGAFCLRRSTGVWEPGGAREIRDHLLGRATAWPAPYFCPELYDQLDSRSGSRLDPFVRFLVAASRGETLLDGFAYAYALWDRAYAVKDYALELAVLSGLPQFDRDYYRTTGPVPDGDPVAHYVREGWRLGLSPHPRFDPAAHAAAYPLLFWRRINPFLHWLTTRPLETPSRLPPIPEPDPVADTPLPGPRVSVIVPNYNHARYLPERLESIYGQDFDDFEVILLDDASTDGSLEILRAYAKRYPDRTRLVGNETNGGSVFRQWRAGLALARGELCWIAESDDGCDRNFLSTLVPAFDDEAVMLAHARSRFVDALGSPGAFGLDQYLEPLGPEHWHRDFVRSGLAEVRAGLGRLNTIPNVSGALFRRPVALPLLDDPDWLSMRICGDWVFYLHLLAGGRIAYRTGTTNAFRLSTQSAGASSYDTPAYYQEHAAVARTIGRLYKVDAALLHDHREQVRRFYAARFPDDALDFERLYPAQNALPSATSQVKTVLVSLFAFSLGGGEIAPIRLANALRAAGLTVLVHSLDYTPPQPAIRGLLRPDIPVVTATTPAAFLDLLDAFEPDVINSHHHAIQAMLRTARRMRPQAFAGIVNVCSMHGMYEAMPAAALDAELPGLCASADYWTYVADKNVVPFQERGLYDPATFIKIPNGMTPPDAPPVPRRRLGIADGAFVVCLASRALTEKGWREAVWCVDLARELSGADIHLLLLGDGPLYEEFACLSLPEHIHLLGLLPDACPYYATSDMGFLPSRFRGESMPLTVMEALMVGRPVLATAVGEVPDMLCRGEDLAGAVVPLCRGEVPVVALAEALAGFATDPQRLAAAARTATACAARFHIDTVAARFIELFCLG